MHLSDIKTPEQDFATLARPRRSDARRCRIARGIGHVRVSVRDAITPVIRVTTVVLEGKNPKMVGKNAVEDRERKSRHEVVTDIFLDNVPPLECFLNDTDGPVRCVETLTAESRHASLIKLSRFGEFRFGVGVVNQAHPIARRAACMTSS